MSSQKLPRSWLLESMCEFFKRHIDVLITPFFWPKMQSRLWCNVESLIFLTYTNFELWLLLVFCYNHNINALCFCTNAKYVFNSGWLNLDQFCCMVLWWWYMQLDKLHKPSSLPPLHHTQWRFFTFNTNSIIIFIFRSIIFIKLHALRKNNECKITLNYSMTYPCGLCAC